MTPPVGAGVGPIMWAAVGESKKILIIWIRQAQEDPRRFWPVAAISIGNACYSRRKHGEIHEC
jgi:hypothetical protein